MNPTREHTDDPDELVTVARCPGCEQLSFPADLQENHEVASTQVCCPRCGTKIAGVDFYDYVDYRVVEYE